MNVNITLFVQIFNFWIAYWVLRLFIFRPAVRLLYDEEEKKEALTYAIAQEEANIADVHHKRQLQWQQFRIHCQRNNPTRERTHIESVTPGAKQIESVTSSQLAEIIAHAQKLVVERLRSGK